MYYESKYTDFTASEPPYTDKIYYKDGNKTVAIIHVDNNWNMWGEVIDPFDLIISPIKPIFRDLTQKECERMLMKDMPKPNRRDVLDKYNMKVMDYATLMYSTRLINLINCYWVAWSENDRAEDYHPRFNEELMKEREKTMIKLDYEPEDDEPPAPYWVPDWENNSMFSMTNIDDIADKFSDYTFGSDCELINNCLGGKK